MKMLEYLALSCSLSMRAGRANQLTSKLQHEEYPIRVMEEAIQTDDVWMPVKGQLERW
jgi:hypothetical protein